MIVDTFYLVLLTSRGEVPWCGHWLDYQPLEAISESCIVVRDQCFYSHPSYKNVRQTKIQRYYSSQTIPYTTLYIYRNVKLSFPILKVDGVVISLFAIFS